MRAFTGKHWPLFSVMGAYWITVIVTVILSIHLNGQLIYPLDDTYIHMAMAKNVALHHVWGVTKYEFSSTDSSLLWTSLLAVTYLALGVNEQAPLILNLLFGTLAILSAYIFLTKYIRNRLRTFIVLSAAVFVTPIPSLTLSGMEHVLHMLLSLSFVYLAARTLSQTTKPLQKYYALLIALSPFVTTVRYEGVFLVFVVCVLFLLRRKVLYAVTLGITALLPLILYGIWSVAHGWYFLPNPLLLKGNIPGLDPAGVMKLLLDASALHRLLDNWHILILLTASLTLLAIYYRRKEKSCDDMKYAHLIFVGSLLLHIYFASTGWLYRYEAYLVFLGVVVVGIAVHPLLPEQFVWKNPKEALSFYLITLPLIFILTVPFLCRAVFAHHSTLHATNNIYEQQYQMGLFIKKFYEGKSVVLNDIGAVTYLADIQLADLNGLGSVQPETLKRQKNYTTRQISDWAHRRGAAIAIVYDGWFDPVGGLPPQWVQAGQWRIPGNVICANDTVSLYAVDPSGSDALMKNIRQFSAKLPADVHQDGKYMEK